MLQSLIAFLTGKWRPKRPVELQPIEVIASIDQGTQSSRVFLYGKDEKAVASSQETFKQHYPERGCVFSSYNRLGALGA